MHHIILESTASNESVMFNIESLILLKIEKNDFAEEEEWLLTARFKETGEDVEILLHSSDRNTLVEALDKIQQRANWDEDAKIVVDA